jgi:hypothetical protein
LHHLTRLGVTAQLTLGKDQLAVDTHFKDPAAALTERDGGAEFPLELRRQTGGAGLVVSHHAILNRDLHGRLAVGGGVENWSNPSPPSGVGKGPVNLLA